MSDCECLETKHDETMNRINETAEIFSAAFIVAMVEGSFCEHASKIVAGKVMAAVAARICIQKMSPAEIEKYEAHFMILPETRQILETIAAHARHETEEVVGARN
jgi:hypothetical protein